MRCYIFWIIHSVSFPTVFHCQSISNAVYTERKFKMAPSLFSNNLIGCYPGACIRSLSGLTRSQAWRIWHCNESPLSRPLEGPHAEVWVTGVGRQTLTVRVDPSSSCHCSPALEGQLSNGNWVCFVCRKQEKCHRLHWLGSLIRPQLYFHSFYTTGESVSHKWWDRLSSAGPREGVSRSQRVPVHA